MTKNKQKVKGSRSRRRQTAVPEKPPHERGGWKLLIGVAAVALVIVALSWPEEKLQHERTTSTSQDSKQSTLSPAEQYLSAIVRDPTNDKAHYNLGLILHQQGKLNEAVSHYKQALAISPGNFDYRNNLAAALAAQGKLEDAIEQFQQALIIQPQNVKAHFNLGNALFSDGQHDAASKQFRRVIELDPNHARAHNNLAVALKETGQLQEAYRYRNEAMRIEREQQGNLP